MILTLAVQTTKPARKCRHPTIRKPSHGLPVHSPKPRANAVLTNMIKSKKTPATTIPATIKEIVFEPFSATFNFIDSTLVFT
jgi:hypothetical protein